MLNDNTLSVRSRRHCRYLSGHHFCWIPFKRRYIFKSEAIIDSTKEYVIEAIENNDMELIAIEVDRTLMDHVHVFVSIPPRLSAAKAVNIMKGYSSRYLRQQFPELAIGKKLWAKSYYWGTTGNVSAEIVKRYIEECQG